MSSECELAERRGRTRIALSVPLLITSLDPNVKFQAIGDALDVSSSGVQLRLSTSLPAGTRVRLDILNSDRVTEGHVVRSVTDGTKRWNTGIQLLEQTGNFWDVTAPPKDWNPYRTERNRCEEWMWLKTYTDEVKE